MQYTNLEVQLRTLLAAVPGRDGLLAPQERLDKLDLPALVNLAKAKGIFTKDECRPLFRFIDLRNK
ncbi:MAG TPA: hypothetical protein VG099_32305, partial [Gemmataceae bacterium]|nr:hypothetical protein [Gemmataceae bacterium]